MNTWSRQKRILSSLLLIAALLLGGCVTAAPVQEAPRATETAAPMGELTLLTPAPEEDGPSAQPDTTPEETDAPEPESPPAEETPTPLPVTEAPVTPTPTPGPTAVPLAEDGVYTSRDDVALYLYIYGHLPSNFITKREAQALGWSGGGLDSYAYGCCIGGDRFGNYEGLLPEKPGRYYNECDIDTLHARNRGAKRIVFSNDGLIYYTGDHYESFTLLYGEE